MIILRWERLGQPIQALTQSFEGARIKIRFDLGCGLIEANP